jgi:predicted phosphodiesterase
MKYLIISDVHSNLPALDKVIDFLGLDKVMKKASKKDFDKIISLGDVVGYNPFINECLKKINDFADVMIPGNHEVMVYNFYCSQNGKNSSLVPFDMKFNGEALMAARWSAENLSKESFEILEKIVKNGYVHKEKGLHKKEDIIFAHSTPYHPEWMQYIQGMNSLREFIRREDMNSFKFGFVGHLHIPQIYISELKEKDSYPSLRGGLVHLAKLNYTQDAYDRKSPLFVQQEKYNEPIIKKFDLSRCEKALIAVNGLGQPRDELEYTGYVVFDSETKELTFTRIPYNMNAVLEEANKHPKLPSVKRIFEGR